MNNWLSWLYHSYLRVPFRLAYDRIGTGKTTIVLLHGIASDRSFWKPLIAQLDPAEYTIIAPDLLGHGASPKPPYIRYSSDDQARAVMALCKQLRLRSVVIVGHSMGCLVATRLASEYPGFFQRILLYEPPLFADVPEFKTHRKRRAFYFAIYDRIAQNPAGALTMTRLVARLSKNWTRFLESEQTWLPIERSLRNNIMQQTSYEELKDITIATDIVHGRFDVAVSRVNLAKMLQDNANIRFYRTTDRHRMSKRSALYLKNLLALHDYKVETTMDGPLPVTKPAKKKRPTIRKRKEL